MVKRYQLGIGFAGKAEMLPVTDGESYPHAEYVVAADYDALAVESEARHQSCLVLIKSVTQHRARIAALEAALRWAMKQVDDRPWPEREYPPDLEPLLIAALAPESPKGE